LGKIEITFFSRSASDLIRRAKVFLNFFEIARRFAWLDAQPRAVKGSMRCA
jgi:hypothetical protein